jgi:hypothetical protein
MKKKINRFTEDMVFKMMIGIVRYWTNNHMDQWEKVKFDTSYGKVFLTISRHDHHPDSFDEIL